LEVRNATIRANRIEADSYKFDSTSNLEIGTANLFVDTTTSNVGVGTNLPLAALDVRGGITKTLYNPGEVIEELNSICDGSVVVVKSNTYTMTDVTAVQSATTTHTEVTGSAISYTPPPGTKRVYYRFWFHWDDDGNGGISHFKPQIDGNDIYAGARTIAIQNSNAHGNFPISIEYTIDCNATTTDSNTGKFTSWTTPKTLRVMFREYNGTYQCRVHANNWWDGTGVSAGNAYFIAKPHLTIRAIA